MPTEIKGYRAGKVQAVAALFRSRPNEWIPARELMKAGGECAWRTRVSDCRLHLHMPIRSRLLKQGRKTVSEYCFSPESGNEQLA